MQENLIFVIGPPRSGSTMLQRMLGSHSDIHTHPEPHIITPLAHLGYFQQVDRAPYDHINATQAIREFVNDLPGGEDDYVQACRAYCDVLYGKMLETSDRTMFLDKTPAYGLVLPFLTKVYPRARYIVLTRHPLAVLSSYANSFFEGDFQAALDFNDILGRYVPALAAFLGQDQVPYHHLRYEDLVARPEEGLAGIFHFLGLKNQSSAVDYGDHEHTDKSYGDPKVKHHRRPTTASVNKWADHLAADEKDRKLAERTVARLVPEDVAAWGFDKQNLFEPLSQAGQKQGSGDDWKWLVDRYRLKRKVFLKLRRNIDHNRFGQVVRKVKYYCDVLLRE